MSDVSAVTRVGCRSLCVCARVRVCSRVHVPQQGLGGPSGLRAQVHELSLTVGGGGPLTACTASALFLWLPGATQCQGDGVT